MPTIDRRTFLRLGALAVPAALAHGAYGRTLAHPAASQAGFSLSILTDRPDEAIRRAEAALKTSFRGGAIAFREQRIQGAHVGDIVLARPGLVDYRAGDDALAEALRETAQALRLPMPVNDPVLLRFQHATGGAATEAIVQIEDRVAMRLDLTRDLPATRIEGPYGSVTVAVDQGAARIVDASCRHKTCTRLGGIDRAGESLVCIPARISVQIDGPRANGIDSLTF
ncbi:MAG: NusG domain II-containing protein [Rhodothermales bacterium]